jgi:BirA family transcriptional regulator, biotin operon repressor / biotin---[acetyl-CoA-carboxylase] ligase
LSPPDAGIYLSFLLRPGGSISSLPLYTIAAGAACAQAIYECAGIRIGLKWVNDLIYDGKKLGGILAELPSTTSGDHISTGHPSNRALIIGIGVNLTLDESTIPDELSQRVDWLERISNQPINPNLLVATIAQKLETACENLEQGNTGIILKLWKDFSITLGRTVQTAISGKPISGMAVDITPNGALIVATAEGESIQLSGGEITIRGADGGYT